MTLLLAIQRLVLVGKVMKEFLIQKRVLPEVVEKKALKVPLRIGMKNGQSILRPLNTKEEKLH
jgi:hypothetical protein